MRFGDAPTEISDSEPKKARIELDDTEAWEADDFVGPGDPDAWAASNGGKEGARPDTTVSARSRYLGDYELQEMIGKGGMGVVYRARQITLNREVALKLIRHDGIPTEAEQRRFRHEAEAVASLDHAGIVPIHEIGRHHGRYYFSMKLISGESLQKATARLKGNFRAIATILEASARAIQHAHERGLLHRDLKPGNILLDADDVPRVTDFGLAKRIETGEADLTQTGAVIGTPAYMAPEQTTATRGTITTSTDIYGLGGVLYALLSGQAPHRGSSVLEVLDAARERTPDSLTKLDPTIPGDLEVICMKCLDKDPKRRYHSAEALADDLKCWLDGRPITARSVSPVGRIVMWCKRKPLAAGLAAALLISIAASSVAMVTKSLEIRRQNEQVQAQLKVSRSLNEFVLSDLLAWSSPFVATRRDVPVSTLLDRSARNAATRFAGQPKIEGSIRQVIGNAYLALGMLPKAETELLLSSKLHQNLPEGNELDRLSIHFALACLRLEQGDYEDAEAHASKAYNGRKQSLGESDVATLDAAALLGAVLKLRAKTADSRTLLEPAAEVARQTLGDEHRVTLRIRTNLAIILHDQGHYDEAIAILGRISEISHRIAGANHPETILARSRLGASLQGLSRNDQAETILDEILQPAREVLGPEHAETLRISNNLAAARCKLGRFAEAVELLEETIKDLRAILSADHPLVLKCELNLAVVLLEQDKPVEAEPILRDLLVRMRPKLRGDDDLLGSALFCHASALRDLDKAAEAEDLNREAIAIFRKTNLPAHPRMINAQGLQAALLLANGKTAQAETLAREVLGIRPRSEPQEKPWRFGDLKCVLGGALAAQKKFTEAEPLLLQGLELMKSDPKVPRRCLDESLNRVIQLYEAWEKPDEAARWREPKTARSSS